MSRLYSRATGQAATIQVGTKIFFITKTYPLPMIALTGPEGDDLMWGTGEVQDNKQIASFLRSVDDFKEFVRILADTHSLGIRPKKDSEGGYTVIEFVAAPL